MMLKNDLTSRPLNNVLLLIIAGANLVIENRYLRDRYLRDRYHRDR